MALDGIGPAAGEAGLSPFLGRIHQGEAAEVLSRMPAGSVDLVVTSPPYWTAVRYAGDEAPAWAGYEDYVAAMARVFAGCARVLRPNGKLCVNAPLLPVPQAVIPQHTRHLKDLAADLGQAILRETGLLRYGMFVWQKQTSKMMFGSYPYPGNILENNTVELIHVYVKPGKPPRFAEAVKAANRLGREEWLDLTQQVWCIHPEDRRRGRGHPAPFPETLPARLIRLYTHGACEGFGGEVVLDPFAGSGTSCVAAKRMGRRWIGIELVPAYARLARERVAGAAPGMPLLRVGRARYPSRAELLAGQRGAGSAGKAAEGKHKRRSYGRGAGAEERESV